MATMKTLFLLSTGAVLGTLSLVAAAQTVTSSPFSNKNKKKAWETVPAAQQQTTPYKGVQYPPAPPQQPASSGGYYTPPTAQPSYATKPTSEPIYTPKNNGSYTQNQPAQSAPKNAPVYQPKYKTYPSSNSAHSSAADGQYYPGKQPAQIQPTRVQPQYQNTAPQQYSQRPYSLSQPTQNQYAQTQYPQGSYQAQPNLRNGSKPSWAERLGIQTTLSGHAKAGIAAVNNSDSDVDFAAIADLDIRGEVSAITSGGLEYGAGLRARAQYDKYRRGFGGRVGDCPATDPLCSGILVGADTRAIKGHTGQFYTAGNADIKEAELGLEGAYLFLRSSYGDVLIGRDDGSAFLFSGGAPSLLAVNASNSSVDYTGLDSVKTYNDASGFSEKIAYTSPRMLGDSVGVGVQFGASYALNARACGVDYCVKENTANALDPFAPDLEDVFELGVALDRTFSNGLKAELTGTYARGSEKTGNVLFDDLQSYGVGLELTYGELVFGTSYLNSNNAFAGDGNYIAYDAGITWKPSNWGFSASYGHAKDDVAHLTSDQGVLGVSYDFGKFRLGTGVQHISRKVPTIIGGARQDNKENATALFIEGAVTF